VCGSRKNMEEIRGGMGWRTSCRRPSCGAASRVGERDTSADMDIRVPLGNVGGNMGGDPYAAPTQTGNNTGDVDAQVGVKREAQVVTPPSAAQFPVPYSPRPHHHSAFPPRLPQYCIHPSLVTAHPRLSSYSSLLPGSPSSLFSVTRVSTSRVLTPSRPGERKGGGGRGEISGTTSDTHARCGAAGCSSRYSGVVIGMGVRDDGEG
jgi:hypothetical protein